MPQRVVRKCEYDDEFQCLSKHIRQLMELIEKDSEINYEGFQLKQALREIVRELIKIKKELYELRGWKK